jgi:hypothetical protein
LPFLTFLLSSLSISTYYKGEMLPTFSPEIYDSDDSLKNPNLVKSDREHLKFYRDS